MSFLALSHAPPPVVIEIATKRPVDDRADEQAAEHLVRDQADDDRDHDRDQRRAIRISLSARRVSMSTHVAVLGLRGALHDALDLAELAAHLLDDLGAGAADRFHRHRAEQVGHHAADEQADDHHGFAIESSATLTVLPAAAGACVDSACV